MLAIELAKGDKYCATGTAVLRVAPRKGARLPLIAYFSLLLLLTLLTLLTSHLVLLTTLTSRRWLLVHLRRTTYYLLLATLFLTSLTLLLT